MRSDEEFVRVSLERHLQAVTCLRIVEGEDPPDYYVLTGNNKILLEVTNAEDMFNDGQTKMPRKTIDVSLARLCEDLTDTFGAVLPENHSILLYFQGPFTRVDKVKREIGRIIQNVIDTNCWVNTKIDTNDGTVTIKRITYRTNKVIGIIGVRQSTFLNDIDRQAELVMADILTTKEKKTKEVNGEIWTGQKWLGILNNCVLATSENFIRAVQNIDLIHSFDKVYLIEQDGVVVDLLP